MAPISLWWKKEGYINIFSSSAMMLAKKVGKRKKSRNRKWQSRWRTISLWQGIVLMCRDDAATICKVIWYFFTVFYKIRDIQLYRPCSDGLRATSQFGPTLSPMNSGGCKGKADMGSACVPWSKKHSLSMPKARQRWPISVGFVLKFSKGSVQSKEGNIDFDHLAWC